MTLFYLPDLGEGLHDAEIHEWYVKLGNFIKIDTPMVAMETAKAIVDIPAPCNGKVTKLYGKPGDTIKTGEPLIDLEENIETKSIIKKTCIVGNLQTSDRIIEEQAMGIQPSHSTTIHQKIKATPSVRALAKKMHVDLNCCTGTGHSGQITVSDLERITKNHVKSTISTTPSTSKYIDNHYEPLRGVRRTMAVAMSKAHQLVVPVTLVDDADIYAWTEKTDVTLRLIRAIMAACQREPRLNAWFDEEHLSLLQHQKINLGIAMDTPEGLFVPVLKNIALRSAIDLRKKIDEFKTNLKTRSILAEDMNGATFILSNVGVFAGRYATPIIIPPMVAILAAGRINEAVVLEQGKAITHKLLPLSLTVDHRAITGGEAARFLSALIRDLQSP